MLSYEHGFDVNLAGCRGHRMHEMVIFCHRFEPVDFDKEGATGCQFLDGNTGLSFVYSFKCGHASVRADKPAWKSDPPTFVGSSVWWVRLWDRTDPDESRWFHRVRLLDGFEAFALIGWDPVYWRVPIPTSTDHYLCHNMAGNSFSGFIIPPLIASPMVSMQPIGRAVHDQPHRRIGGPPPRESIFVCLSPSP